MRKLCVLCAFVFLLNAVSAEDVDLRYFTRRYFPRLSVGEDFDGCLENTDGVYYSVDVQLKQDESPLSKSIQLHAKDNMIHYNYSNIHRAICGTICGLNKTHTVINETVRSTLKSCLNKKIYDKYGLEVDSVTVFYVKTNDKEPLSFLYYFAIFLVATILLLNLGGSLYTCAFPVEKTSLITAFSIKNNWKELCGSEKESFKCIQALRFYTNLVTLALHSGVFLSSGLIQNEEYIEDAFSGIKSSFTNLRIVMQTFFVIGGFLMANKVLGMIEKNQFGLKCLPKLLLNRYLRIMPTLLFMVVLTATWIPKMGSGCLWERVVVHEGLMCKKNWWHLVPLVQNFFPFENECLPQTWYLGADWQLFNFSLIILLLIWKFPKHGGKLLLITSFISILVIFLQSYILNLRPIRSSISPDLIRTRFQGDDTMFYSYFSPQCNWAGYHIGVLAAYIYRKSLTDNWDLKNSRILKMLFLASGPIVAASIFMGGDLHKREASRFEAAIFNSLDQNLFAAAIAVQILGCLFKMNDFYINILEWKPLQSLGRLSYCSLLIHTGVLRTYGGHQLGFTASDYNFVMLFAGVFCVTYVLSVPLYILVEAPAGNLLRMLLNSKKVTAESVHATNEKGVVKKMAEKINAQQISDSPMNGNVLS